MGFREFQIQTSEELKAGKSVLVHAPTGLGKTWATAKGFVDSLPKNPQAAATNALLGTRLLHVLPMRALANSVAQDLTGLLDRKGFNATYQPTIHHGQQQESEIFAERVAVTTIDQYLAGFAGAPLSFASKSGHAVAGAIVGSYSVFDEVHLLGPERGLPLLYAILQQRQRWGLLSAVMTATLPKSVRVFLQEQVGLVPIELTNDDIQQRDGWRSITLSHESKAQSAADVVEKIIEAQRTKGKVIAFVNTVDAAIKLYRTLEAKQSACELHLIHSNYAPSHRKAIESKLLEIFGRNSTAKAILVTTQVAEAGINISAPAVFSELAPVDSLIQRAGRCARFKEQPEGTFIVYKPEREESHVPYNENLVDRTAGAFEIAGNSFQLDWKRETDLVDEVLGAFYEHYMANASISKDERKIEKDKKGVVKSLSQPQLEEKDRDGKVKKSKSKAITIGDALGLLNQTFHSRNPSALENALREINNVQVIVVSERPRNQSGAEFVGADDNAELSAFEQFLKEQNKLLPSKRDTLESVSVSFGRFSRSLEEHELWELRLVREEYSVPLYDLRRVNKVRSNSTYVLVQADAGYSPKLGLTFGVVDELEAINGVITPVESRASDRSESYEHYFQNWHNHCSRVYRHADEMLTSKYSALIRRIADKMCARGVLESAEDFSLKLESMIRVAALFHDLGKLNKPWQEAIGWKSGEFWAKSQDNGVKGLPPHACYALPALRHLFKQLGMVNEKGEVDRLAELMALASARHHSLGSLDGTLGWLPFESHPGVIKAVHGLLEQTLGEQAAELKPLITNELLVHLNDASVYPILEGKHTYTLDTPSPSEDYYPFYVLASRIIKVGDWEASGQREVELCK